MYILPDELRQYLQNKGFWTNVWEKSKEWLEKHHADMDKINELKKFISDRYH
jgi:muconolactone delta-isomerase